MWMLLRRSAGLVDLLSSPWLVAAVVAAQAVIVIAVNQIALDFTCIGQDYEYGCRQLRESGARAIGLLCMGALYAFVRREAMGTLIAGRGAPVDRIRWAAVQGAGFLLMLAPAAALDPRAPGFFLAGLGFWLGGATLAGFGAMFWFAAPRAWAGLLRGEGGPLAVVLAAAFFAPDIVLLADPLWSVGWLTDLTFAAVRMTMTTFSAGVVVGPAPYTIGLDGFVVNVAPSCSGVQGFALIALFILSYAWIFRAETRFPHFWIVLPLGVLASWCFNVIRISALIWIGARVSPDLAVNGFHSHAGWLMFSVLALGVVAVAHLTPWLRAAPKTRASRPATPFFRDRSAAEIMPFVIFMFSATAAAALIDPPALAYPVRALMMLGVLAAFWRVYAGMDWRTAPLSWIAGVVCGVLWLVTGPEAGAADATLGAALSELGPLALGVWVVSRIVGTAVLVPLIEELMFRGYVMRRLDVGGPWRRALALAASALLFAALHDRWIAAALAGLLFGILALRTGRLSDAVAGHAAANIVIAAWAVAQDDWSVI